jgi:hypothetical protein
VLLLCLATACGGSSGGKASADTSSAPSPTAPALDAASAHRIAVAAQITAADLPGYKEDASAAGDADAPDATDKEVQACISGVADPTYLADVTSSDFTKSAGPVSQVTLGSETQIVVTTQQGQKEFAALAKPTALTCLNTAFKKIFTAEAGGGAFTGELKRADVSTPPGADKAARFVLDGAFTVQGVTVKLKADFELFLVGRAEITLHDFAIGDLQVPEADRARLRAVLVARGRAAQK